MRIICTLEMPKLTVFVAMLGILILMSACGSNTPVSTNNTNKVATPTPTPGSGPNPETHEPPIVGRGGSFALDFPSDKDLNSNPTPVGNKFKYVKSAAGTQRAIQFVKILTETNRSDARIPAVLFETVECAEADNCRLELWFQTLKNGSDTEYDPIPAGAPPETTIQGSPLEVVVDKRLKNKVHSHNPKAPHRYEHGGFSGKHYRVAKWRVVKADGTPVNFQGTAIPATAELDNNYTFYISSYHTH